MLISRGITSEDRISNTWVLILINFDPIQDIGPSGGVGALSRVRTL